MALLAKIVNNVNLQVLTIPEKILILDAWLSLGCASADWYITVLIIQTKIYKHGRQVKMESFQSTIFIWSLSHRPTIKTTIKSISMVPILRIFVRKIFLNLLSKYRWHNLFLVKSHAFSIFFWTPVDECVWIMKIVLWGASYFRR